MLVVIVVGDAVTLVAVVVVVGVVVAVLVGVLVGVLVAVAVGVAAGAIVAATLSASPLELLTRTQYWAVVCRFRTVNVLPVAPFTGWLVSPAAPRYHW